MTRDRGLAPPSVNPLQTPALFPAPQSEAPVLLDRVVIRPGFVDDAETAASALVSGRRLGTNGKALKAHKPPGAAPNKRGTAADLAASGVSVVRSSSEAQLVPVSTRGSSTQVNTLFNTPVDLKFPSPKPRRRFVNWFGVTRSEAK